MRRSDIINNKLDEALAYLVEQETKLKPCLEKLGDLLLEKIHKDEVTVHEVFDMYTQIQQQYTDSILLITKIKEVLDYNE